MMPGLRSLALFPIGMCLAFGALAAQSTAPPRSALADTPRGFIPPPLHPRDTHLRTVDLGHGAYALVSSLSGPDNIGFVVGETGVLVIDTHINAAMAGAIQEAVRAVTDKPIRFVVNTNYHGDHTFGNHAFPPSTVIIAHRDAADRMRWFEEEKADMIALVGGDESLFDGVIPRLPDVVFSDSIRVDLGGRSVSVYHFGPGASAGDAVVWDPMSRTLWTGNLAVGAPIPILFEFGASTYLHTLRSLVATLGSVDVVVPGHLALTDGRLFHSLIAYSEQLLATVRRAIADGVPLNTLVDRAELPAGLLPAGAPAALVGFLTGVHRLDLLRTYQEEQATQAGRGSTAR